MASNPLAYSIDGTGSISSNTIPYQQSNPIDTQQQLVALQGSPAAAQAPMHPTAYQIIGQQQQQQPAQQQSAQQQQAQQQPTVVTLPQGTQADYSCPTSCPTPEGIFFSLMGINGYKGLDGTIFLFVCLWPTLTVKKLMFQTVYLILVLLFFSHP